MVVGTSAGSLVGSLYAFGLDAFQIQDMALKIEKKDVIDYTVPDNGFIKGEKLEDFINRTVRNTPIEKLGIRFYAVATDIVKGEEAVFVSGNTGKAVRASCSVPGVFQPVKMSGRTYVDGGVVSPVAVDVARRNGADVIIAVDISGGIDGEDPKGTMDTILQSVDIMYARISENQLKKADVVIRPNVRNIGSTEMEKRHQAILEGRRPPSRHCPAYRRSWTAFGRRRGCKAAISIHRQGSGPPGSVAEGGRGLLAIDLRPYSSMMWGNHVHGTFRRKS